MKPSALAFDINRRVESRVDNVTRAIIGIGVVALIASAGAPTVAPADDQFFRDKVAPVLERRCIHCHGGCAPKGKLSLTTAAARAKGRRQRAGGRAG